METEFTPWAALGGGALIGLSAVLLMAFYGRIMGATGILAGLLRFNDPADWALRAALVIGGLIVGVGVSYGGGCTSGHGVCGIARGSLRSIVATGVFMTTAIVTVFVTRHLIGG